MTRSIHLFFVSLKLTSICILVAVDFFLVVLLLSSLRIVDISAHAKNSNVSTESSKPNYSQFDKNLQHTAKSIGTTVSGVIKNAGYTASSTAQTIGTAASSIARGFTGTITNPETIIKPSRADSLPEIKTVTQPYPKVGHVNAPPAPQPATGQATKQSSLVAVWPLHGRVTTEFGVYHQPFQPWHTGIDISSPLSIRAPITPFREGIVIDVIYSSYSLGNHVIVDHGKGLTSYYAHLSSITVKKGQTVKPGDIVGYEGSTGASTGPHLHFEIRQNNTPINPRKFITGSP